MLFNLPTNRANVNGTPITELNDEYGNLQMVSYFAARYEALPSTVAVRLHLNASADTYHLVLRELDIKTDGTGILTKDWMITNHRRDPGKANFVDQLRYADPRQSCCIDVMLSEEVTTVTFYFDASDRELEARIVALADRLKAKYLVPDKPMFEVLTVGSGGHFGTTSIEIKPMDCDIERHYNDDFAPVNDAIRASITEKRSGLILLHGTPGTGKTSYIKHLIAEYPKENLIFIPNDFVQEMLQPGFINFLLSKKNSIIVIEDAEKVIMSRTDSGRNSVVSTILQITDGLFSDFLNIKIICTFNTDVSRIDKALFRKGRMIAFYEFGELTVDKARALVGEGPQLPEKRTLAELFNLETDNFQEAAAGQPIGFRRLATV